MKITIWNILLGFVIIYLIFQIHSDIKSHQGLSEKSNNLKVNFVRETTKQKELKDLMSRLNDKRFVEQMARAKLNLVKKGETAYKICR
ncbi:MAG: septum formation initiator family protein [Candidatus Saganbacteria bacterium]|nr:septum formation initiator family protein [Candidatus Saganbacteria bacterium]